MLAFIVRSGKADSLLKRAEGCWQESNGKDSKARYKKPKYRFIEIEHKIRYSSGGFIENERMKSIHP
ncbi:hypothetical protein [Pontibacter sp. HSC-36F09]|uniref:hypothetical protein n=1 Tax=Pontibacter sp. HSC-36F09 TaxID=2910966 RepID=UPI00209D7BEB|nr:hypothetical protein [Pontibacter sp. HSC-36F09]MCP2043291.1 hypothetical protein [Pontibacter sp. HSC-36F09]